MSKLLPSSKRQSGRRHWTLARRRPQSLLISSSLLCGRHLLQRGGRSCPSQARPAPITPLEATGACPWLGWSGPLAGQEPAQGSILTNIYTCGMQVSTPLWSWYCRWPAANLEHKPCRLYMLVVSLDLRLCANTSCQYQELSLP